MLKFNHTAHKEMWAWLSENPAAYKGMWPGWEFNGGKYNTQHKACFARGACDLVCEKCPLIWPEDSFGEHKCWDGGGLYTLWSHSRKRDVRTHLAHRIANLPVKEGVETE